MNMLNEPTLKEFITAHELMYTHYNELCDRLTPEQWAIRSLCPDWDVRGVIAHVMGVEHVLNAWVPSTDNPPPFDLMTQIVDLDPAALGSQAAEITSSRLNHLRSQDPSIVDTPSITPTGIGTYGRFLRIRVFDMWVHTQDIAIPMGRQLPDEDIGAQMAVAEVASAIGYIVGKKIGLPDGMSIVFHITGGVQQDLCVVVDGRAVQVDSVATPDVEVTADVETFMMLAAGRIDPQTRIDSGRIRCSGDAQWGDRAVLNLAYTM